MSIKISENYLDSSKQFLAGGIGGIFLVLAGHPMDTIKVRLQTMSTSKDGKALKFNGTIDCINKTWKYEGINGFYRGMFAPLIAATPINAVTFFGFGLGVSLQTDGSPTAVDNLTLVQLSKAGMLSGALTAIINAPTERIKCLLQVEQSIKSVAKYKSFWHCASTVYGNGGLRSLYTGFIATLSRDIPGSGAYFATYHFLQLNANDIFRTNNQTLITLLSGGLAGMAFWTVAIPADVIKSRIQTAPQHKYDGFRDAIRYVYEKHGWSGFYRGVVPIYLRAFPANAACFFGFEYAFELLNYLF